ncbi:MarR family winged helix-turn-helix transcriptional regulator [Nocardioides astragali]|nr:MarR family transcriptional regulator [Nocardioides astragali]
MATLAQRTNATLPRLSHVVRRLEDRGLVKRVPCPEDGRATTPSSLRPGGTRLLTPRLDTWTPCAPTCSTPSPASSSNSSAASGMRCRPGSTPTDG